MLIEDDKLKEAENAEEKGERKRVFYGGQVGFTNGGGVVSVVGAVLAAIVMGVASLVVAIVIVVLGLMVVVFALSFIGILVVGIMYDGECPLEPMIPKFLIAYGAGACVSLVFSCWLLCCIMDRRETTETTRKSKEEKGNAALVCGYAVNLFAFFYMVAWFIAGNYFVYRTDPEYTATINLTNITVLSKLNNSTSGSETAELAANPHYCAQICYRYAFWFITSHYIVLAPIFCCIACVALISDES